MSAKNTLKLYDGMIEHDINAFLLFTTSTTNHVEFYKYTFNGNYQFPYSENFCVYESNLKQNTIDATVYIHIS